MIAEIYQIALSWFGAAVVFGWVFWVATYGCSYEEPPIKMRSRRILTICTLVMIVGLFVGCATPPPISEHQAKNPQAFELVDFTWCGPEDRYQCQLIRQGSNLLIMNGPSRIDDGGPLWW